MNDFSTHLRHAEEHLAQQDDRWRDIISQHGPCRLCPETQRSPYEALVRAIAHQQLHGKAAQTILGRFVGLYNNNFPPPQAIVDTPYDALRGVGFSNNKVLAIQDIALKTLEGIVPTATQARKLTDRELVDRLITIRGVGQWTVEMLLIFTLGRLDVFPVDDYGVKVGFRLFHHQADLPAPKLMHTQGLAWAPYRSVAAWYLWRMADALKQKPL